MHIILVEWPDKNCTNCRSYRERSLVSRPFAGNLWIDVEACTKEGCRNHEVIIRSEPSVRDEVPIIVDFQGSEFRITGDAH